MIDRNYTFCVHFHWLSSKYFWKVLYFFQDCWSNCTKTVLLVLNNFWMYLPYHLNFSVHIFSVHQAMHLVTSWSQQNGKIARIELWIASPSTVFSGFGSEWLLPVCRPKKNAPGKEIWLQWRSDCQNWRVFWSQR